MDTHVIHANTVSEDAKWVPERVSGLVSRSVCSYGFGDTCRKIKRERETQKSNQES